MQQKTTDRYAEIVEALNEALAENADARETNLSPIFKANLSRLMYLEKIASHCSELEPSDAVQNVHVGIRTAASMSLRLQAMIHRKDSTPTKKLRMIEKAMRAFAYQISETVTAFCDVACADSSQSQIYESLTNDLNRLSETDYATLAWLERKRDEWEESHVSIRVRMEEVIRIASEFAFINAMSAEYRDIFPKALSDMERLATTTNGLVKQLETGGLELEGGIKTSLSIVLGGLEGVRASIANEPSGMNSIYLLTIMDRFDKTLWELWSTITG